MRIAEFVFSVIVAFATVYLVLNHQKEVPETLTSVENGYTVTFTTIPTVTEDTTLLIPFSIIGPKDSLSRVWFRNLKFGQDTTWRLYRYAKTPLTAIDPDSGKYEMILQTGKRSNVLRYYFELRDPVGRYLAGMKLGDEKPLTTKVVGKVDSWIKYGYFLTMFLAILFVTKGAIGSVNLVAGNAKGASVKSSFVLGLVFSIVSAVLLRSWYGLQLDGFIWQALPFGTDLGDNLQQILIFYLLLMVVLMSKPNSVFKAGVKGTLGILSFFIIVAAYLLPLALGSAALPVSTISYSAIAVIVIAILLSFRTSARAGK